jgi:hypothetical protein
MRMALCQKQLLLHRILCIPGSVSLWMMRSNLLLLPLFVLSRCKSARHTHTLSKSAHTRTHISRPSGRMFGTQSSSSSSTDSVGLLGIIFDMDGVFSALCPSALCSLCPSAPLPLCSLLPCPLSPLPSARPPVKC